MFVIELSCLFTHSYSYKEGVFYPYRQMGKLTTRKVK